MVVQVLMGESGGNNVEKRCFNLRFAERVLDTLRSLADVVNAGLSINLHRAQSFELKALSPTANGLDFPTLFPRIHRSLGKLTSTKSLRKERVAG